MSTHPLTQPHDFTVDDREKGVAYWEYVEERLLPRWLRDFALPIIGEVFGSNDPDLLIQHSDVAENLYWDLTRSHELRRLDSAVSTLAGILGLTGDPKTEAAATRLLAEISKNLGAPEDVTDWLYDV